jgi:hypothetical protein
MRRALASVGSLLLLLFCATPSQAWWLFHHHHAHAGHYGAMAPVAPVGVPLTFQLPGGFGINTSIDPQKILSDLQGALQKLGQNPGQTPITLDSAVKAKVDSIQTQVNSGVDDLNKLTDRMNKKIDALKKSSPDLFKDQAQFNKLDKLQVGGTSPSGNGGSGTPSKVDGGP